MARYLEHEPKYLNFTQTASPICHLHRQTASVFKLVERCSLAVTTVFLNMTIQSFRTQTVGTRRETTIVGPEPRAFHKIIVGLFLKIYFKDTNKNSLDKCDSLLITFHLLSDFKVGKIINRPVKKFSTN